jgi:LruC domain-containing protein
MKITELYDPNNVKEKPGEEQKEVPPIEEYFDFATTAEVSLYVNYSLQGMPLLLELYSENPVITKENGVRSKRQDINPLFMAYTDEMGKYEGTITLPIGLTTVYLYSREMGLPECVELEVVNEAITFDNTYKTPVRGAGTRAYTFKDSAPPYKLEYVKKTTTTTGFGWNQKTTTTEENILEDNLYSLYKWTDDGRAIDPDYIYADSPPRTIPVWDDLGKTRDQTEELGSFTGRLTKILWDGADKKVDGLNNSAMIGGVQQTNFYLKIPTKVTMMFLHERAGYLSAFGYYYYKGSGKEGTGEKDVTNLPKYVIFSNVSISGDDPYDKANKNNAPISPGDKVDLLYFGEDGVTGPGTTQFPADYTIGWFLIPDAYLGGNNTFTSDNKNQLQYIDQIRTSNDPDAKRKFVSIYDEKLRGVVVGCEDGPDDSYEDMLFCVFTDDMDAIIDPKNPGRPYIDKDNTDDILPADATLITRGTLAFEDIWPDGGDYDMNDVALEYTHSTTFNYKNEVVRIEDFFRPTNDGATIDNAFAYQVGAGQIGELVEKPNETFVETETNSIIVYPNNREAIRTGKTYNIVRDFSNLTVLKDDLEPYNPYIILRYLQPDHKTRTEVHLPKRKATSLAEQKLLYTENDAFFIDIEGKYPFAIDIPIHNYRVPTESTRIDAETEYPDFKAWADSKGATNKDWYLNYAGNK